MNHRPIELVIRDALAITKLTRAALAEALKQPLGNTVAGRKLLNSRDFSMNDVERLRSAIDEM